MRCWGVDLCAQVYPNFIEVEPPENGAYDKAVCKRCFKRWQMNLPKGYLRLEDGVDIFCKSSGLEGVLVGLGGGERTLTKEGE
jgi:hypothetical protein